MALSYRLTTLDRVKKYLVTLGTQQEGKVEPLIDAATLAIEGYCQNAFVQRAFTDQHTGGVHGERGGAKRLFLSRYPIVSVASITDPAGGTVAATDYVVASAEGYLEHVGMWPAPTYRWSIAYTAGRFASESAVNEDVRLACHMLIEDWLRAPTGPISSKSGGQRSVQYESRDIPERVRALLEPYRSRV